MDFSPFNQYKEAPPAEAPGGWTSSAPRSNDGRTDHAVTGGTSWIDAML
jgi:hypothetical protein